MSYKERNRKYWFKVAGDKCQFEYYTETEGWRECGKKAKHIHHIRGESETLLGGGDSEQNIGLPLCEDHHVRNNKRNAEHTRDFSFHPDIGDAFSSYHEWKSNERHMNSISGKRRIDYSTSPFADVNRDHKEKIKRGERYMAGSEEIDRYYEQKMRDKSTRYLAETGERQVPTTPHKDYDPKKKKHWTDIFFGKD